MKQQAAAVPTLCDNLSLPRRVTHSFAWCSHAVADVVAVNAMRRFFNYTSESVRRRCRRALPPRALRRELLSHGGV